MTSPGGVVALLFTDIVRSTELLSRLGDDAADELRRRHFAALRQAVAASGGEEVKSLGDGLMVSFTSPVAALSCAVAMQDSVEGSGFELRIGVHAGEPIREESDLFGGAVVVAKRLCDTADGGQILTSQLVVDLVGGRGAFRFRPLGPVALKGLPEPVRTVAVERADRAEVPAASAAQPVERPAPRTRVRRPRGPRLVGRKHELEVLEEELRSAAAGEFRCVLLTAEAGFGKTRLAAELAARHGEKVVTLSARAHPMGETAAFGLWAEALDGYLRSLEPRDVSRLCGGLLDDLAGLLRSVAAVRGSVPDRPAPRTSLLEGIAVVINNLSRTQPVLVLLDDLHQSDASSWETLDYLARGLEAEPVLVVMGARPAELSGQQVAVRVLFGLDQDGFLRRLPLTALPATGIAELVGEILHSPPAPALVSWLTERSGGNPLFALGLLRALVDEGADLNHPELRRIPEDLAERFQGVLATFSEPALAMIELLSVLGHPATMADLTALSDRPPELVTGIVEELLRSKAVVEEESAGEIRYGFFHPLIQETTYQSLGATRRRALHRMVGRALRSSGQVAEAAPHFARSAAVGDDEAIAALLEGIRRAEEREAYRESLTLLSGLVDVLPSGDDRWLEAADALALQADWLFNDRGRGDRLAIAAIRAMREIDAVLESISDDGRRAAAKLRLATFLVYSAGELEEGLRTATAAEDLYRAAGDDRGACFAELLQAAGNVLEGRLAFGTQQVEALLLTPAVAADEGLATRVRSVLGLWMFYAGSFGSDEANLRRNLTELQGRHQEYLETLFLSGLSTSLAYQGRTAEARTLVQKAKAASTNWRDAPVLEHEVQALWLEGDLTTTVERAEEILEWNPDGMSRRRAMGLAFSGMAAMEIGRLDTARRYVDLALAPYEGQGFAHYLEICQHADSVVRAQEGRRKEALEALTSVTDRLTDNGFRPYAMFALTDFADLAAKVGDAELTARAARTAASVAAGIDRDCYRGLALLTSTWAALAAGVDDEAANNARDSVKVLSRTGWRLFHGRALDGLGRALRHSDPAAAREALDEAAALFEACGATWRRDRALEARP